MEDNQVIKAFNKMGARARVFRNPRVDGLRLNVLTDKHGEFFDVNVNPDFAESAEVLAVDVQPEDRHLVLMVKYASERQGVDNKDKFLCGHDERHWFVAPVGPGVASVLKAKESLRPTIVQQELEKKGVKSKKRNKRRNEAYVRQGEWFFIPRPDAKVNSKLILKKEPLRRGAGKPHVCEMLYREGGVPVMVSASYPNGLTDIEYTQLVRRNPEVAKQRWDRMVRNPRVLVMGAIRHPDHSTVTLGVWHEVVANTERTSGFGAASSAFLD